MRFHAFILWDRLFGTYHPPERATECGIERAPVTDNPLRLQFGPLLRLLHRE